MLMNLRRAGHKGEGRRRAARVGGRIRNAIRDSLFLKVYLTLLCCLAAVVVASALYWSVSDDFEEISWRERFQNFFERMVPESDDPQDLQRMVERLGAAFDANLGLYGSDGQLIASSGQPPPLTEDMRERESWRFSPEMGVMPLKDGRVLVANFNHPWDDQERSALLYLAIIAVVIGAAAYPVVRHLTRRLEILRDGVRKFGEGALSARVPVDGKDEVAAVATSFNEAAGRIEKLVGAHRTLLANASHELRSPLARLRMAVDLLKDDPTGKKGEEVIANLNEIDELVEEILLASRLNHVRGLEKRTRVDLTALVAEECAQHNVEVSGSPIEVMGDARLLTRLVRNLVTNALRHGAPPVEVEIGRSGASAFINVRDHGAGLPPGEEARIFEAFYRPAGRSESAGGWGLGLALVQQIAELHGGSVRYERPRDNGAKFIVTLPMGGR